MTLWSFAKYAGCGNDFILFDNRHSTFPLHPSLIQRLCHRQLGIGADGLILMENSRNSEAQFRFRIFNSDGSEAEMCGNGIRCFVKWLSDIGFNQDCYHIETMQCILKAQSFTEGVCVDMGSPRSIQWNIPLRFEDCFLQVHYINTGVPHTILFADEIENINLLQLGGHIRNYSLWAPQGSNFTIVQKKEGQRLKIRTYERGVEGETLACGTGATAAALAAAHHYQIEGPIAVETRSGEELTVGFSYKNQTFSQVTLTGSADCIFKGTVLLDIK